MYKKVTKNSPVYKLDLFCSEAEDFFSRNAAIPILGTVPALLRVAFGAVQFTSAVATSAISLFFCTSSIGREVFFHSLRHIFHGLVNILAGVLQAIPIIGSIIYGVQALNEAGHSDALKVYINEQRHKFFGYKTIRDNTWTCYQAAEPDDSVSVNDDDVPTDAWKKDVIIAAV
jgi:hypothetical protein